MAQQALNLRDQLRWQEPDLGARAIGISALRKMVKIPMKPFTDTGVTDDGRLLFEMQLEGIGRHDVSSRLVGDSIIDVAIPLGQSVTSAWFARIMLGSGSVVELTASSTSTQDWKEYGTINLRLVSAECAEQLPLSRLRMNPRSIKAVKVLELADSACIAEAGIAFELADGGSLIAFADGAPGCFFIEVST